MTPEVQAAVLALDVGTSSARASLYDLRGRPIRDRVARVPLSPSVTPEGGAQFDPRLLLEQLSTAVDQVLSGPNPVGRQPLPPIVAVATDTFWHSLVGLDAHGQPLTPVYLWLDARSREDAATLRQQLDERAVHARTGCGLHWSYWPAKLSWLRRREPALFERVRRWVSFGEFVLERWTGQPGTSVSMASGTGLLDIHTCRWDQPLLSVLGLDEQRLGELVPLSHTFRASRQTASRWPALRDVPWLPAIGDGASSNVGAGCTTPSHYAVMIGTSAAERVAWRPDATFEVPWGTWCYRIDEQRTVSGGAFNDGGSLLAWLRTSLRLPSLRLAEAEVATLAPDSHGLTVLPFWGGERSPGWADDARGAVVGLRLHTRPVDVLRACLEAIALRIGELDRLLLRVMPSPGEVVGTGGALLHSPAWMQILADVLGRPVLASSEPEASSRGASLLALETLGLLDKPLDQLHPAITRRFEPIAAHTQQYALALERQRRLYTSLVAR